MMDDEPLGVEESAMLAAFTAFCARHDGASWTPDVVIAVSREMWSAGKEWQREQMSEENAKVLREVEQSTQRQKGEGQ